MKKQILIITLASLASSDIALGKIQEEHVIRLTSPIIELLDGTSIGLSGDAIGLMLQIRRELRKMLFGIPNKDGSVFTGIYEFNGETHSLITLAKLEGELDAKFYAQEQTFMQDTTIHSDKEWKIIQQAYEEQKDALHKLMIVIKEDFKTVTRSYLESARGYKQQILALIAESCKLRGKKECILLNWGEAQEGHEHIVIDNQVPNFATLTTFFTDLMHYLEDMVNSCDIARNQFMKKVRSNK